MTMFQRCEILIGLAAERYYLRQLSAWRGDDRTYQLMVKQYLSWHERLDGYMEARDWQPFNEADL